MRTILSGLDGSSLARIVPWWVIHNGLLMNNSQLLFAEELSTMPNNAKLHSDMNFSKTKWIFLWFGKWLKIINNWYMKCIWVEKMGRVAYMT